MISLRYHAVSIAAVFLAIAVGVVLGASGVSDRMLSAVRSDREELGEQVSELTAERDFLAAAQRASDEFTSRTAPAVVRGALQGRTVALVTSRADTADREAVVSLLGQAGATVTGEVELTEAIGDPARADQLRELIAQLLPTGAQLPAASDTGSLAGSLLGGVLTISTARPAATAEQAQAVVTGLMTAGFVRAGDVPAAAELVLVLTGGALTGIDAGDAAAVTARLAAELDRTGTGAVLAGGAGSADTTGVVGVARADPTITAGLSTVDDVHTGPGRVSVVLALGEQVESRAGRYGRAVTAADGVAPAV